MSETAHDRAADQAPEVSEALVRWLWARYKRPGFQPGVHGESHFWRWEGVEEVVTMLSVECERQRAGRQEPPLPARSIRDLFLSEPRRRA